MDDNKPGLISDKLATDTARRIQARMITDDDLAQGLVAMLPDFHDWGERRGQASGRYGAHDWHLPKIAYDFVRDPRVAMAVIEKCQTENITIHIDAFHAKPYVAANSMTGNGDNTVNIGESLPRTIIEAGLEAMKDE